MRPRRKPKYPTQWKFQFTHLLRGATIRPTLEKYGSIVSIHAPLARCDRRGKARYRRDRGFNSRTSCEVRPIPIVSIFDFRGFNSRTSCEVRLLNTDNIDTTETVSIHAPLARCDFSGTSDISAAVSFNSRTSCEVRHPNCRTTTIPYFVSIHAPLARCDANIERFKRQSYVSIHAPLARCDFGYSKSIRLHSGFQFTHLLRGATNKSSTSGHQPPCFNSRTSCEVRLPTRPRRCRQFCFNSRTSCEVRHDPRRTNWHKFDVSIHAPLARCDIQTGQSMPSTISFNSRTSCEVRLSANERADWLRKFQFTHLLRGATDCRRCKSHAGHSFNSRTSCEVRRP